MAEGDAMLARDGVAEADRYFPLSLDLRYRGQAYEIRAARLGRGAGCRRLRVSRPYDAVRPRGARGDAEIVTTRLAATGVSKRPKPRPFDGGGRAAPKGTRSVFADGRRGDAAVYDRDSIGVEDTIAGPAILEEAHSTLFMPAGWTVTAAATGDLIATRTTRGGRTMKMQAAILRAVGAPAPYADSQPIRIEEVELEGPRDGEVLVRIGGGGLYHSDLSVINGNRPRPSRLPQPWGPAPSSRSAPASATSVPTTGSSSSSVRAAGAAGDAWRAAPHRELHAVARAKGELMGGGADHRWRRRRGGASVGVCASRSMPWSTGAPSSGSMRRSGDHGGDLRLRGDDRVGGAQHGPGRARDFVAIIGPAGSGSTADGAAVAGAGRSSPST